MIRHEWTSGKPFNERSGNVTGEDPKPDRLNDDYFLIVGSTIFDDHDTDCLVGGPGEDLLLLLGRDRGADGSG